MVLATSHFLTVLAVFLGHVERMIRGTEEVLVNCMVRLPGRADTDTNSDRAFSGIGINFRVLNALTDSSSSHQSVRCVRLRENHRELLSAIPAGKIALAYFASEKGGDFFKYFVSPGVTQGIID